MPPTVTDWYEGGGATPDLFDATERANVHDKMLLARTWRTCSTLGGLEATVEGSALEPAGPDMVMEIAGLEWKSERMAVVYMLKLPTTDV